MIEDVKRSLVRDLRENLKGLVPRSRLDSFLRWHDHASLEDLDRAYRATYTDFQSGLALWTPNHEFPLHDARSIRIYRQCVGFFSRLHACVSNDAQNEQLAKAKHRVSETVEITADARVLSLTKSYIRRWLGPAPDLASLRLRHGPGAVAGGEKGHQKSHFKHTFDSVDRLLGYDSECLFRLPTAPYLVLDRVDSVTRVVTVPKDCRGVRIISCEPMSMQFLQQGLLGHLMRVLPLRSEGRIEFLTQHRNQELARLGSYDPSTWATIDFSDASDTIRLDHIKMLFPSEWVDLFCALRSPYMRFPDGDAVEITTAFPMGAALCFPAEALVFASLAQAITDVFYCGASGIVPSVTVFGDDVIIHQSCAQEYLDASRRFGLRPSDRKCFFSRFTHFRESCGHEYFAGERVDVIRPRFVGMTRNPLDAVPMVQHATRLYERGFSKTAQLLASCVRGPVAIGVGDSYASPHLRWPMPGRVRWNRSFQRLEQRAMVVKTKAARQDMGSDGYESLFQWFTSGWSNSSTWGGKQYPAHTWLLSQQVSV